MVARQDDLDPRSESRMTGVGWSRFELSVFYLIELF